MRRHVGSIMVGYCVALHLGWAGAIAWDDSAVGATAVDALYRVVRHEQTLIVLLVVASVLACAAMVTTMPWAVVLLIPQQSLLLISAAGAVAAMVLSQFADGVARPRPFIVADQLHIVLAALGHAAAIIAVGAARNE
jgi:hypothetical protein